MDGAAAPLQQVVYGELTLDLAAHRCLVSGQNVALTALEFKLLALLARRQARVQTRQTLLDEVWPGTDIDERTVDAHVKRLREKLGTAARYVQTARGLGYIFSADLSQGGAS